MKVSYYELLGMIKEGNIPEKIEVQLPNVNYSRTYCKMYDCGEFSGYYISEEDLPDGNYQDYLADCFLESDMFKDCIVIKNDDFEDIKDIDINLGILGMTSTEKHISIHVNQLIKNQKKIINILKEK